MSDGDVDFHMFVKDICAHSVFAFPLFVPSPSTNLLSKETTSQSDQAHAPTFN